MVNTPLPTMMGALRRLRDVALQRSAGDAAIVEEIIGLATKARKTGLVSLESDADQTQDPFLRKTLTLFLASRQGVACLRPLPHLGETAARGSAAQLNTRSVPCARPGCAVARP